MSHLESSGAIEVYYFCCIFLWNTNFIAEIVTAGIIGFSCASTGFSQTLKNTSVSSILSFWIMGPISCVVISYIIAESLLR